MRPGCNIVQENLNKQFRSWECGVQRIPTPVFGAGPDRESIPDTERILTNQADECLG